MTERDSQRERNTSRGCRRGRSRLPVEEPDVGLNPGTPGSRPEPKADAEGLRYPGAPTFFKFFKKI